MRQLILNVGTGNRSQAAPYLASCHLIYPTEQHTVGDRDGGRRERLFPEGCGADPATDSEPDGGRGRGAAQATCEQSVASSGEQYCTDGDIDSLDTDTYVQISSSCLYFFMPFIVVTAEIPEL